MRRLFFSSFVLLGGTLSCESTLAGPASQSIPTETAVIADPSLRSIQRAQLDLQNAVDRFLAQFPLSSRETLHRRLSDAYSTLTFPENAALQRQISEIYRLKADLDSRVHPQYKEVPALLALADEFPDPTLVAVVVRRTNQEDLIVLPRDKATVEALHTAVNALFALRRGRGDVASENYRMQIRPTGQPVTAPSGWSQEIQEDALSKLRRAQVGEEKDIPGIGHARTTTIPLISLNSQVPTG
jgi:hypothetical protein